MEEISDRESFEMSYSCFIFSLKALASPPSIACELYGHFNVASELQYELSFCMNLPNQRASRINREQAQKIWALASAIRSLPKEAYLPTEIIQESLKNMYHPAWVPLRAAAEELLELLRPLTEENERYFADQGTPP